MPSIDVKDVDPRIKNVKKRVFYEENNFFLKTLNKNRCWQINKIIQPNDKIPQ